MSDFVTRLQTFLELRSETLDIRQLTPDASTREYFRINWKGGRAIACVYPEAFIEAEQSYLDVTKLFLSSGLPVAKVLGFDEQLGVIVIEDFGDTILRDVIRRSDEDKKNRLYREAIDLIAKIQAATPRAFEMNSVASQLKFDTEKLLWELNFFKEHYFTTYRKRPLDADIEERLDKEFLGLSQELDRRASVLCHRDFHAANLMVDDTGGLKIIDHQDARIGTASYDLVSLLLDRVTEPPSRQWLSDMKTYFLAERERNGLDAIDKDTFDEEFELQSIQRCLKAVGTFSFQFSNRGKTYFEPFIAPTIKMVTEIAANTGQYPILIGVLDSYSSR